MIEVEEVAAAHVEGFAGERGLLRAHSRGQPIVDLSDLKDVIHRVVGIELRAASQVTSTDVLVGADRLASLRVLGCRNVADADLSGLARLENLYVENCLSSAAAAPNLKSASLTFNTRPRDLVVHAPLTQLRWEGRGANDLSWISHPENLTEVVVFDPGFVDVGALRFASGLKNLVLSGCQGVSGLGELRTIPSLALTLYSVKRLDEAGALGDLDLRFLEVEQNYTVHSTLATLLKKRVPSAYITPVKSRKWASPTTKSHLSLLGGKDVVSFNPVEVTFAAAKYLVRLVPEDLIEDRARTIDVDSFRKLIDADIMAQQWQDGEVLIDHEAGELIYLTSSPESAEQVARLILRNIEAIAKSVD